MTSHSLGSAAGCGASQPFTHFVSRHLLGFCLQAMLSIGAAMLGAQHVLGVDLDDDALRIAQQNVDEYEEALPVGRGTASCILYDAADRCTGWLGLLPAVCTPTPPMI